MNKKGIRSARSRLRVQVAKLDGGLELIICAPPVENEEMLAKRIWEMMRGAFASAGVEFDAPNGERRGVSES